MVNASGARSYQTKSSESIFHVNFLISVSLNNSCSETKMITEQTCILNYRNVIFVCSAADSALHQNIRNL